MQTRYPLCAAMVAALCLAGPAVAQVSADQVAKLKTSLTPGGAETRSRTKSRCSRSARRTGVALEKWRDF